MNPRVHLSVVAAGAAANQVRPGVAEGTARNWRSGGTRRRRRPAEVAAAAPQLIAHAQILTRNGSGDPLAARSSASALPEGKLQYSIQSRISCGEPDPTLAAKYGSAPISRQKRMNSCVPKLLSST